MAKLTETQLKRTVSREKQKQDVLAQKIAIQEKKQLYGEHWREVEQKRLQKDLSLVMGDAETPNLYNFKDVNEYFDPINFYRDKRGETIQADYEEYKKTEDKYRKALDELDRELQKNLEEQIEKGILKDESIKDKGVSTKGSKDAIINATKKLNEITSKFFNRYIPIYDKHVCVCCGKPKKLGEYWITFSPTCSDRVDVNGAYHLWLCKDCCYKLFAYLYTDVCEKNLENATKLFCSYTNYYWDFLVFDNAKSIFENGERIVPFIEEYVMLSIVECPGLTFMDSPFLKEKSQEEMQELLKLQVNVDKGKLVSNNGNGTEGLKDENGQDYPIDWTKEDVKNKKSILRMVGYDPFEWESDDHKRILYKDLLNILEPGMENDLVKFQAAIQIVSSFFRVRQMNKKQFELEQSGATLAEIKAIADLKTKELSAITQFSKDNGFSERYANAKAKGENTFTGIMAKMNEEKFEKAILNRYDIETSETIQQAADASFKAIFNQLSLGESEVWKITQEQLEELRKLRRQNSDLAEQLRKAKYELEKVKLEEIAKEEQQKKELEQESYYG